MNGVGGEGPLSDEGVSGSGWNERKRRKERNGGKIFVLCSILVLADELNLFFPKFQSNKKANLNPKTRLMRD